MGLLRKLQCDRRKLGDEMTELKVRWGKWDLETDTQELLINIRLRVLRVGRK